MKSTPSKQQQKTHKNSLADHTLYMNSSSWQNTLAGVVLKGISAESMSLLNMTGDVDFSSEDPGVLP